MRLKQVWEKEYATWRQRDLSGKRYAYVWVDGIYFNVRLQPDRPCVLVVVGATHDGRKELLAVVDGERESSLSWRHLLEDLKARGLTEGPCIAVGDRALGFWKALREAYPRTREQQCWVHKTANVLDKLPKGQQPDAKQMIHDMYLSPTKKEALAVYQRFLDLYEAKYPKACECLRKDEDVLFTFYDFPADHWAHLRTTNPIESTFSTVRHRTRQTKGCGSRIAALTMVFKLATDAEKHWRRLRGYKLITQVIEGVPFIDGEMKEGSLKSLGCALLPSTTFDNTSTGVSTYRKKLIEVSLPLDAINKASAREKSIRHGHPSTLHLWWARRPLASARAVIFAQMVDDPSEYVDVLLSDSKRKRAAIRALKKRRAEQAATSGGSDASRRAESAISAEPAGPATNTASGDHADRQALRDIAAELERDRLFRIIEELVLWENTTNEEVLDRARAEIWQSWRRSCAAHADHPRAREIFDRDRLPAFHDPFAGGGALPLEAQRPRPRSSCERPQPGRRAHQQGDDRDSAEIRRPASGESGVSPGKGPDRA